MQEIIRLDLETVNCYLLPVKNGFILVDTGGFTFQGDPTDDKCKLLENKLIENGCVPGTLLLVILTHGDVDHSANCKFLQEKYNVKIVLHKMDLELTRDLTVEKVLRNFKFKSKIYTIVSIIMSSLIKKATKKIVESFVSFNVDEFIDEEYNLLQYNLNAKIVYLPGHTNGYIGILLDDGNLISGDIFANVKKPSNAMNALNFSLLNESILKLKNMNIKNIYPGHGTPFMFSELLNIDK